jgi:hypothetical protein
MGSVPPSQRGAASGMRSTFQNSGTALSIGVFFSLMIAGLAATLPRTLTGREFFPHLISAPFHHGLTVVFGVATVLSVLAAGASLTRGGRDATTAAPPSAVTYHGARRDNSVV